MPDPRKLRVGDLVRFVAFPDEWSNPSIGVPTSSRTFMKKMIARTWPARVFMRDDSGYPWIRARMRSRGKIEYHTWLIVECTGWKQVKRRRK